MPSEIFSLSYEGAGVREGEMDVAEFGPALVAMGELFTLADEGLNETKTSVTTRVKADFKKGRSKLHTASTKFFATTRD